MLLLVQKLGRKRKTMVKIPDLMSKAVSDFRTFRRLGDVSIIFSSLHCKTRSSPVAHELAVRLMTCSQGSACASHMVQAG